MRNPVDFELTPEEQLIEDEADQYVSMSPEKMKKIDAIIEKTRKKMTISLRISKFDLDMVKYKAVKEGLPYQTLITSIIHKYVTDGFCDREELRKITRELRGIAER